MFSGSKYPKIISFNFENRSTDCCAAIHQQEQRLPEAVWKSLPWKVLKIAWTVTAMNYACLAYYVRSPSPRHLSSFPVWKQQSRNVCATPFQIPTLLFLAGMFTWWCSCVFLQHDRTHMGIDACMHVSFSNTIAPTCTLVTPITTGESKCVCM